MSKTAKKTSTKPRHSLEFLAAQVAAAEKDAELAHIQMRHAKSTFKQARRQYKAAKARAKKIRKQAKAVARDVKKPLKKALADFIATGRGAEKKVRPGKGNP